MRKVVILAFFVGLSLITCVTKKTAEEQAAASGNAPTRVQIKNEGNAVTTVTLTAPAPFTAQTAVFNDIPAGTTTAYQNLFFSSYSGVTVSCTNSGCLTHTVIINRNADNIIHVKNGLEPAANPNSVPPTVSMTSPVAGASNVSTNASIVVTFSEPMFTATITANTSSTACSGTIQLSSDDFTSCVQMASAPTASGDSTQFTVTPASALATTTAYKIRVTTAARDKTDVPMANTFTLATAFTTGSGADTTPPGAITLSEAGKTSTSVTVSWTESGDDGMTGNATSYQLRYSTAAINSGNFTSASLHSSGTPSAPGTARTATVTGLSPGITYHFMYRICDEVPNCTYSNNLVVTTDSGGTTTTTGAW